LAFYAATDTRNWPCSQRRTDMGFYGKGRCRCDHLRWRYGHHAQPNRPNGTGPWRAYRRRPHLGPPVPTHTQTQQHPTCPTSARVYWTKQTRWLDLGSARNWNTSSRKPTGEAAPPPCWNTHAEVISRNHSNHSSVPTSQLRSPLNIADLIRTQDLLPPPISRLPKLAETLLPASIAQYCCWWNRSGEQKAGHSLSMQREYQ